MTLQDIAPHVERIGCFTITTLERGELHSRIISICGVDAEGLHFLTMNVKPFYRQLKANPRIALCGIFPSSRTTGRNAVGQPTFEPGFTLRISGEAHEVPMTTLREKAAAGSPAHAFALEDHGRYPAIRLFTVSRGKGEIFDFDFEKVHRDHKLLRTRFAFGGESFTDPGARIDPDLCIGCGECVAACSFDAVEEGEPYRIIGPRCDECGNCLLACPQEAISLPPTI